MESWLLYILIVVAIGSGWWLGRRERGKSTRSITPNYYQGLNHLLNEEPDRAVATFINDLEVNPDTLETHLALGGLLRRRGDIEKAVVVHENILHRASLDKETMEQVQLELARDYLLAGLLDRAEELSTKLSDASSSVKSDGLKITLEIYEREKEWSQAIEVAKLLAIGDKSEKYEKAISHYYCEVAEDLLADNRNEEARIAVTQAIGHNANNPRASLIHGRVDINELRFDDAIRVLQRISHQDPVYVPESLEALATAYEGSNKSADTFREYLTECLDVTEKLYLCLRDLKPEIKIEESLRKEALRPIERMLELSG